MFKNHPHRVSEISSMNHPKNLSPYNNKPISMYIPMYIHMYIHYFYGHTYLTRNLCAEPNILEKKQQIYLN